MKPLLHEKRILVAGARGMIGTAIVKRLKAAGCHTLFTPTRTELDLSKPDHVRHWFERHSPDVVVVAAAKIGSNLSNCTAPADYLSENMAIALNTIEGARQAKTPRLLFIGSSCVYPQNAPSPLREDALLAGPLEPSTEAYAVAKIAGMKFCQACRRQHGFTYHSLIPSNLYGPGDDYHHENSHVLPALIRRFHDAVKGRAETATCWGTGAPRREFLHIDDLAEAVWHVLSIEYPLDWYNVGSGEDLTIGELADRIASTTGFKGKVLWDHTKPDGPPRKTLDASALRATGWAPQVPLGRGLEDAYADFVKQLASGTLRA